jgi:hypothetical protein
MGESYPGLFCAPYGEHVGPSNLGTALIVYYFDG